MGQGVHRGPGCPHAEVEALAQARGRTRGATVYVTLEPCCHHGRTPPCTGALTRAGVVRVVASMADPNPKVSGRGLDLLRNAGLRVEVGLEEHRARRLNEAYVKHVTTGLPLVTYKYAMTLDGKTASSTGESRWISGGESRAEVHRLRGRVGAILVGAGTARTDDPRLTCRVSQGSYQPWRVVVDSQASLSPGARLITSSCRAPAVVAVGEKAPQDRIQALEKAGAQVWVLPLKDGRVSLLALMQMLGRKGINHVLLEGGGELAFSMMCEGLVDKVLCYLSPRLMGGREAFTPLAGTGQPGPREAWPLEAIRVSKSGEDIRIEGHIPREGGYPCSPG